MSNVHRTHRSHHTHNHTHKQTRVGAYAAQGSNEYIQRNQIYGNNCYVDEQNLLFI